MIIIPTQRNSKYENEIVEILKKYGVNYYCDNHIYEGSENITCISIYKPTKIFAKNAVVIFTEKTTRFITQELPISAIGICEENNKIALSCFKKNRNAVLTCGINNKNTVTISSITDKNVMITLQRSVIDLNGKCLEPMEFKIINTKKYLPYSIIAAAIALILNGIIPSEF